MSKSRDIADSAATINFIDGVTSNVQTQLNTATTAIAANTTAIANISVTSGSQTKTYANNETSTITLSQAITSGAPVVSVTKEVPQTGLTDNTWDVASDGANYDFENSAYSTTLTPSNASADGVFTLGSGSFAATDLGKIVSGNGGTAVITKTDGSYNLLTNFTNTSAIASGSWTLKKLVVDGAATGIALSSGTDEEGGVVYSFRNGAYTGSTFSVASQDGNAQGLVFNNDGTKMYMVGQASQAVHQYTLSTAFSISTASYDSVSISVSSQDTYPTGLCFNNDGTKMYVCGRTGDSVYQYTLSTAFDLSTASYASLSISVAGESTNPQDVALSSDGTQMFITDRVTNKVSQWTLSTAFNVSSASYSYKVIDFSSQGTTGQGTAFSSDGYNAYVYCNSNNTIFQYNTQEGSFNLTNSFYSGVSLDITIQGSNVTGVVFNSDQSKMYTIAGGGKVDEYSLDPRFNVKSTDYKGISFSLSSQVSSPSAMALSADGTKMYVLGENADKVFQYTLSTAFDLSTASYASKFLSVASQEGNAKGLGLSNDGTKLYVCGAAQDKVFQYTLSTAFDLSTASYASLSFSVASQESSPTGIRFNTDGTKMYVSGYGSGGDIFQYSLSTAFNASTASYDSKSLNTNSQESYLRGFSFNSTGTQLFAIGGNDHVYQYYLTTAFDLSTATYSGASFSVAGQEGNPSDVTFNTDGTKLYIVGEGGDAAFEYEMGGAFNLKTFQLSGNNFSVSQTTTPSKVNFSSDGTKMYIFAPAFDSVLQYTLSTAFDLSTVSYDSVSFSFAPQDSDPRSIAFNNNGTKMYMIGQSGNSVFEYDLSTAFAVNTASYNNQSLSVASQESAVTSLTFNADGTSMFIVGSTNDTVFQYTLSTAFALSSASYASSSFSVRSQESGPTDLAFSTDGTKMFIAGFSDQIYQYKLSVAFNVSTASYDSVAANVKGQETGLEGVTFNPDGTKMYIIGNDFDKVHEYNIGTTLVQIPVVYSSDYAVAVTNSGGQINTTYWADVNSTTATEVVGTGEVYYAYSTDNHVTWKVIHNTTGQRSIARNNSGTWQYNSNATYGSETWANATTNTEFAALRQAFSVAANKMDGTQMDAVADANHLTLAGSLDFMIALKNAGSTSTSPTSDGVALNYAANVLNQGAVLGTDYNWDFPSSTSVRLTSLGAYNLKTRII